MDIFTLYNLSMSVTPSQLLDLKKNDKYLRREFLQTILQTVSFVMVKRKYRFLFSFGDQTPDTKRTFSLQITFSQYIPLKCHNFFHVV